MTIHEQNMISTSINLCSRLSRGFTLETKTLHVDLWPMLYPTSDERHSGGLHNQLVLTCNCCAFANWCIFYSFCCFVYGFICSVTRWYWTTAVNKPYLSWPQLWCCVFSPSVGHAPCLYLCFACRSQLQLINSPSNTLPCRRRQIVLRYTVVVNRTWLQYIHFLVVVSPADISCRTLLLLCLVLWIYTSSLPASLPPAWCAPLSNLPPRLTPGYTK